ncbi:hypothetical protein L208DRAFT_1410890 [Tricholoma matsutake]|nr:hypothetical protein L208DRAFT_1410890 [Tricholoma matsutake 945]
MGGHHHHRCCEPLLTGWKVRTMTRVGTPMMTPAPRLRASAHGVVQVGEEWGQESEMARGQPGERQTLPRATACGGCF